MATSRNPAYTESVRRLMDAFGRLPGVGARSAERMAFHILKSTPEEAMVLADAIRHVKEHVRHCSICFNLTEADPCPICADASRDHGVVCIVEQPKDLLQLESTGVYRGVYHVLLGRIAPLENVGPEHLTIPHLIERLRRGANTPVRQPEPAPPAEGAAAEAPHGGGEEDPFAVSEPFEYATPVTDASPEVVEAVAATDVPIREVILATNPTMEGDGTALYLQGELAKFPVTVTRLARGLPAGAQIEYSNKAILADAINGRVVLGGGG